MAHMFVRTPNRMCRNFNPSVEILGQGARHHPARTPANPISILAEGVSNPSSGVTLDVVLLKSIAYVYQRSRRRWRYLFANLLANRSQPAIVFPRPVPIAPIPLLRYTDPNCLPECSIPNSATGLPGVRVRQRIGRASNPIY